MKKHGFRSIFSLLLAVMMVCSMLPTAAFAEGNVEEQPVVVETYTVTYTDGMGGAAFAEQKTEGLLNGDPTPAFAGDPALDGYTFTGWDKEIAATVTESVTYTAQWQAVPADVQPEAQSDVQPEADGNGEIDTYWGGPHPGGGDWHPDGPGDHGPHPDDPKPNKKLQISLYVNDGQSRDFLKTVNIDRNSESGFAHSIAPLSDVAQGNSGKYGEVTSVTGDWTPNGSANEGDTVTWGHDVESGYVVYNVAPQGSKSVTITVRVFVPSTGAYYTVGTDTAGAGKPGQIQSADYKIPPLTKFVDASKFGNVTGVYGNWYFPSTINQQVGVTVQWSTNSGTGTMTYYVDWYNPDGGGDNPTNYLWNFTLKYDANGGTGAPADQTWGTNDKYTKSHTFNIPTTVPTREGYTFKGWSDTKGGSATRQPGGTCLVSQTVSGYNGGSVTKTLYAVWEKEAPTPFTFILKFDANGGGSTFADVTKQSNAQYEMLQIPSTYIPTREGYIFKGWKDTFHGATYQVGSSVNVNRTDTPACTVTDSSCTKTLYAEWEANAPKAPGEEPVMDALKQAVKITCVTPNSGHAAKIYDLMSGYTGGEVVKDSSGNYTYTITVNSGSYLNRYNSAAPDGVGATHELAPNEQPNKQITLKWDGAAWVADTTLPINFDVVCAATIPDPAEGEFDDLPIQIKCDTKTDGSHDLQLSYKDGTYTFVRRTEPQYGYVVFTPSTYLDTYNKTHPGHTLKYPNGAVTWEFEYKDGSWQRRVTDKLPTIVVVCNDEPAAPGKPTVDDLTGLEGPVKVRCTTKPGTHTAASFGLIEETYTIGDVQGNETDGYTCGITVTADKYVERYNTDFGSHTLTGDRTKTLTLKWDGTEQKWTVQTPAEFTVECVTTPPTDKPAAPAYNTIKDLTVKVVCPIHGYKEYGVVPAGLTAGEVQEQNGYYFCTVTIKSDAYVNDFNTKLGVEHTPKSEEKQVLLKYEDGVWVPNKTEDSPVIFNVSCTTQEKPTEETIIKDLGNQVVGVVCTTMPNVHAALYSALREGTFDISDVTTVNGLPSCTITIHAETYVSAFNNSTEVIHQLKYPDVTSKTLQLYYTDGKWTALDGTTPVVFEVVCPTAPVDVPTEEQIKAELGKIQVKCVTEGSGHAVKEYDTSVGGYTAVTMQDKDGKPIYTVTITVPAQRYIEKYNEETGKTHQLASGEKAEKTVVLKYADKKWERVEGDLPVVFQVVCENIPAQKYTVTYTDGVDGVEVFKDQVYADLTAGTATPAFNGTPTRVGYVFAGWNPAVAATVTGNATYTATWKVDANNNGKPDDEELRYTVTYVDGANGKAFASQVYTGLLSGTATPKFNGTPLRSGYVFIGWSPVWSGTVTGNVTYTATWSTVTGGLDKVPKTGDNGLTLALSALLLFSFCGATACVISTKKRG